MDSCEDPAKAGGFPIRKSSDQSSFAAPRSLSQRTTSFIASQRQGIHQMPLSRLIALIINAHPLELSSTQYSAAAGRTGIEERPVDCARFACRTRSGARGRKRPSRSVDRHTDKSLLHDVKEPKRHASSRRIRFRVRSHENGGADRDRTGDLKLAKLALSQLSYGPRRRATEI
jgi:hypothetical protein